MRAAHWMVPALGLACAGCGEDEGRAGDPVSTGEMTSTCMDFMAHATGCGWGGNINGADWNCGEAAIVWRADVFRDVARCAIELPCTGSGATCLAIAFESEPLTIHDEYAARCEARKTECNLVGTGDVSSVILRCTATTLAAYANPVMDAILACFDEPCASVTSCLERTL